MQNTLFVKFKLTRNFHLPSVLFIACCLSSDHELHSIHNKHCKNIALSNIIRVLSKSKILGPGTHHDIEKFVILLCCSVLIRATQLPQILDIMATPSETRKLNRLIRRNVSAQDEGMVVFSNDLVPCWRNPRKLWNFVTKMLENTTNTKMKKNYFLLPKFY